MKKLDFNLLEILLAPQIVWSSWIDCTLPGSGQVRPPALATFLNFIFIFYFI